MRKSVMFVVLGLAMVASACGGSSGGGTDAGSGGSAPGTGGGGGGGGGGAGGGGGSSGTCNMPSCLSTLVSTCQPSGTCVSQTDTTTFASNTCYSNGVKESFAFGTTGGSVVVKKNGSTCYSVDIALTGALTFKNASGSPVATGTSDGTTTTVTCTGGQSVTLSDSCDVGTSAASGGSSDCTEGTCTM